MNQINKSESHISLLLPTHNEETNLKKHFTWLSSCPAIDEIVVVDDNSTDDTKPVALGLKNKNLSVKFLSRSLNQNFSAQKKFGLDHAKNQWILWLDADEKPTPDLIKFLNNFNFTSTANYAFYRQDIFLGHPLKHGETANQTFIRLFDKTQGQFIGKVHETWQSTFPTMVTNLSIDHSSHHSLISFLEKVDFYSTIRAEELFSQQIPVNTLQIILYPLAKFIKGYIIQLGFLDSTPGIIFALGMSFHSFLVRAKLWHLYHP